MVNQTSESVKFRKLKILWHGKIDGQGPTNELMLEIKSYLRFAF